MDKHLLLNVYGVSISHPKDWQIFINPNNKFTFDEGLVKIDKVTEGSKKKETSLSIRWAKMKQPIELEEYVEELKNQFKKKERKSRNRERFKIIKKIKCTIGERDAYLLQKEFIANHSIYRVFGKDERVKVLQMLFYSEKTQRMLIASLLTTPEEFKKNEEQFKDILFTLHENMEPTQTINQIQQSKIRIVN
ncbi:hypothetical protein ACJROX_27840 [Pseudalkalibacillus sp. A8]|uniref:hypothetical protein n=1 Tax=Pseudalkalibacillus sp. A8 TaxID=3382641 RepID=UPI0038B4FD38